MVWEVQSLFLNSSFLQRIKRGIQYTNQLSETVQRTGFLERHFTCHDEGMLGVDWCLKWRGGRGGFLCTVLTVQYLLNCTYFTVITVLYCTYCTVITVLYCTNCTVLYLLYCNYSTVLY